MRWLVAVSLLVSFLGGFLAFGPEIFDGAEQSPGGTYASPAIGKVIPSRSEPRRYLRNAPGATNGDSE